MLRGGASTTHSAGHETADHIGPVAIERACAYVCYNTCARSLAAIELLKDSSRAGAEVSTAAAWRGTAMRGGARKAVAASVAVAAAAEEGRSSEISSTVKPGKAGTAATKVAAASGTIHAVKSAAGALNLFFLLSPLIAVVVGSGFAILTVWLQRASSKPAIVKKATVAAVKAASTPPLMTFQGLH